MRGVCKRICVTWSLRWRDLISTSCRDRTFANVSLYCSKGPFNFSQATLPLLLAAKDNSPHPPSLIFTGATASVKGSANFAAFATMKFALRAMAQSLAREFGPKGVHVAHAVIDGVIDIPRTKEWDLGEGGKIDPNAVSILHVFSIQAAIAHKIAKGVLGSV